MEIPLNSKFDAQLHNTLENVLWEQSCSQKVSKKNYEVSLTLRAVPGLSDMQGPIRTLLYGLKAAKQ